MNWTMWPWFGRPDGAGDVANVVTQHVVVEILKYESYGSWGRTAGDMVSEFMNASFMNVDDDFAN